MLTPRRGQRSPDDPPQYFSIRIDGHLNPAWSESFGRLKMVHTQTGETVLTGPIADQAELHGILASIRDLNLELISVNRIESEHSPDKE